MCRFSYYYHHFCLYFFNSYFFFLSFFHEWVRKNRLLCCFWSYLSVRCRRNCVFLIRFNITVFPFDIWSGSENTDLDIYMKISKNWRIHFLPRPYLGNSLTHFKHLYIIGGTKLGILKLMPSVTLKKEIFQKTSKLLFLPAQLRGLMREI